MNSLIDKINHVKTLNSMKATHLKERITVSNYLNLLNENPNKSKKEITQLMGITSETLNKYAKKVGMFDAVSTRKNKSGRRKKSTKEVEKPTKNVEKPKKVKNLVPIEVEKGGGKLENGEEEDSEYSEDEEEEVNSTLDKSSVAFKEQFNIKSGNKSSSTEGGPINILKTRVEGNSSTKNNFIK